MKKLKTIVSAVCNLRFLKYVVVTVIAVAFIGFVDENSIMSHLNNQQRIGELEDEIAEYTELNRRNMERIREIDKNPKAMEKIARERYFMKADDEDIFVLSDDDVQSNTESDATAE